MKITACGKTPGIAASITLLALGFSGAAAFAAATASDTAGNYVGTWSTSPANNGTGFGAWNVNVQNNSGPPYVGSYLAGSGDTAIVDGSGNAWGTYANGSPGTGQITFTRPFAAGLSGSSSLFNQTFSFDLGSGGVGPGQGLLSAAVGNAFVFDYDGTVSGDNMFLSVDGGAAVTTPINFSELNAGLKVSVAVSGALNSPTEGYTFTVATFTGNTTLFSQSGTFDNSTFSTSQFQYIDSNTTGNGYFNGLNVTAEATPEPTSLALLSMSGLGALLAFRRRK